MSAVSPVLFRLAAAEYSCSVAGSKILLYTDLPGSMALRETITLPATAGRAVLSPISLKGTTKGRIHTVTVQAAGDLILYRIGFFVRRIGREATDWQWHWITMPGTGDDWAPIKVPIPATSQEWAQIKVPVPATSQEWAQIKVPVPATSQEWAPLKVPVPPTSQEWAPLNVPVPATSQEWAPLNIPVPATSQEWAEVKVPVPPTSQEWLTIPGMPPSDPQRHTVELPMDS